MQRVMCLSAVCHKTTAPLLLAQHREKHHQRLGSMLTVLSGLTCKVLQLHCAKKKKKTHLISIKKMSEFQSTLTYLQVCSDFVH